MYPQRFGLRVPRTQPGTDHGTAPVNVIGNGVKGDLWHDAEPDNLVLGDNPDHHRFRQVYATLIEGWLGADAAQVLGQKFETLKLFREERSHG
jgi:uncharacterized protein (DUF1501 family)